MIFKYLHNTWLELNHFLSSTSIHGLPYLHLTQSRTTRIIWTVLVAAALTTATVFLVQTVGDWNTKYISTTLETQGLETFPFPAVTFHPGEFSSQNDFLRIFLNHFQMTRYEEGSPLYDNNEFMKEFKTFISIFKDRKPLFHWVEKYLLQERNFTEKKGGIFRTDVCSLVSLVATGNKSMGNLRTDITHVFNLNIFKYKGFSQVLKFMKAVVSPMIKEMIVTENVTTTEMNSHCREEENKQTKRVVESLLLSYLFTFLDSASAQLGPGDLAAEKYFTKDFLHEKMTEMFNDMTGGSLPVSALSVVQWFAKVTHRDVQKYLSRFVNYSELPVTISYLAKLRYFYFWKLFLLGEKTLYLVCEKKTCSPEDYVPADTKSLKDRVYNYLQDKEKRHRVIQSSGGTPCQDEHSARELEFGPMCDFVRNVSSNMEPALKLLKYSKQSPTFLESEREDSKVFGSIKNLNNFHGFYSTTFLERYNAFVALCKFGEKQMILEHCNLFRRSFTNKGLGYTFNNKKSDEMFKNTKSLEMQTETFHFNDDTEPRMMTDSLTVMIENNMEEVDLFERTKNPSLPQGRFILFFKTVI